MSDLSISRLLMIEDAARRLRDDSHHLVLHETGWELEHNLPCRVRGMRHCEIHQAVVEKMTERPPGLGRFEVRVENGTLIIGPEASRQDAAVELLELLGTPRSAQL